MSTAFGLNLFLLSHLSMSWWRSAGQLGALLRELCPSPEAQGPCWPGDSAAPGQNIAGEGREHEAMCPGRVTGEGERLVCRAGVGSPGTLGTRVIHRVLVSGLSGKQPVGLENTCGIKTGV